MTANTARRIRMLKAMGISPMQLRAVRDEPATQHEAPVAPAEETDALVDVALVIPAGVDGAHLDLLGRAMTAFGARFARAARITVSGGAIAGTLPAARAYLAFGEAQAQALGRDLDATVMAQAEVVLLDPPQQLMQAQGKRRLWVAVNALRRRLRSPHVPGE